jgi:hypothetical protein
MNKGRRSKTNSFWKGMNAYGKKVNKESLQGVTKRYKSGTKSQNCALCVQFNNISTIPLTDISW